jgi:F-type H+-transporting ATPase subunit epsilon
MADVTTVSTRTFAVEIVSPERRLARVQARSLQVPASDGSLGILAGHAPLVTLVVPGVVRVVDDAGREQKFAVGEGFLEVDAAGVRVLVDSAERPEEIDVERARAAKVRAEDHLRRRGDRDVDVVRAEAALARAVARLKAANRL